MSRPTSTPTLNVSDTSHADKAGNRNSIGSTGSADGTGVTGVVGGTATSTGAGTGTGTTPGIRSIREMFEKGSNTGSSSPRGLSPAESVTSGGDARPVRKVRTSFVAVEPSGRVTVGGGLNSSAPGGGGENGISQGSASGMNGANGVNGHVGGGNGGEVAVGVDDKNAGRVEKGDDNVAGGGKATKEADLKGELSRIVSGDTANGPVNGAVSGTGENTKSDKNDKKENGINDSKESDVKAESKAGGKAEHTSDTATPKTADSTTLQQGSPAKSKRTEPAQPASITPTKSPRTGKTSKVTTADASAAKTAVKAAKSPASTPKRVNGGSFRLSGVAQASPRNFPLPASPGSTSKARMGRDVPKSPTASKGAVSGGAASLATTRRKSSVANGRTSESGVDKVVSKFGLSDAGKGQDKESGKEPPATRRKSSITAPTASNTTKPDDRRKPNTQVATQAARPERIATKPGLAKKPESSAATKSQSARPQPDKSQSAVQSPRRSSALSAHLTAPTASSTAKQNSQPPIQPFSSSTSALARKTSTIRRDRPAGSTASTISSVRKPSTTSTSASATSAPKTKSSSLSSSSLASSNKNVFKSTSALSPTSSFSANKRQSMRASLSATTPNITSAASRGTTASRPGTALPQADGSFLSRMMRPTTSSASKAHEKVDVKSPPRRSAPVRTRAQGGGRGEVGDGNEKAKTVSDAAPRSRTKALQDALIGSKGRGKNVGQGGAGSVRAVSGRLRDQEGGKAEERVTIDDEKEDAKEVSGKANGVEEHEDLSTGQEESAQKLRDDDEKDNGKEDNATVDTATDGASTITETRVGDVDANANANGSDNINSFNDINSTVNGANDHETDTVNDNLTDNTNGPTNGSSHDMKGDVANGTTPPPADDSTLDDAQEDTNTAEAFAMPTPKFDRTVIR